MIEGFDLVNFYSSKYKAARAAFLSMAKERKLWKKDVQRARDYEKQIMALKKEIEELKIDQFDCPDCRWRNSK